VPPLNRFRLLTLASIALAMPLSASCHFGLARRVDYSVRPMAIVPLGATVTDRSAAFADTFCATLPHTDNGSWGPCGRYLDAQVPMPPPVDTPITTPLKVMIVGGAFSECFEDAGIYIYGPSIEHVKTHGVVFGPPVKIDGTGTPEKNAEEIVKYLKANSGDYIAVGHSKGAVDLMAAIATSDLARERIKALVSVTGAIGGTRLADLGAAIGILGFESALRQSGIPCDIEDHGGIGSLRRDVRYRALRAWKPPQTLRTYSLSAVSTLKRTSKPLHTMWRTNEIYSIDQDSHIIAEESIIPGSEFLGVARGDHWAVALPMSEHPKTKKKVDQNPFPRTALLESIVRYVTVRHASNAGDGR
jgi:hypothetical protein